MIKIENVEVYGMQSAMRGMRNPKNSWDKSDSVFKEDAHLGPNDLRLAHLLAAGGPVHAKYRRMITVYLDITAPLYWWKEFDTYKVGTVANSCSTMHKLGSRALTLDDFSHEHLSECNRNLLEMVIRNINDSRPKPKNFDKNDWWQMIQLLPTSYNQKRTVMLNYEVLNNIYQFRRNHKLDEWLEFCKWIEQLPYAELITGQKDGAEVCP